MNSIKAFCLSMVLICAPTAAQTAPRIPLESLYHLPGTVTALTVGSATILDAR
jgi:hypothetical protein